jgi:hydroxymethylpyrimidine pyrophosphatase-like HAD family hydrolase
MLEFAGHPVIMGNACEELRGRGWHVTRGNGECGVAAAVEAVIAQFPRESENSRSLDCAELP